MFPVISIGLILLITVLVFIRKLVLKRQLRKGLGRKVKDRELTSINAWIQASDNNKGN